MSKKHHSFLLHLVLFFFAKCNGNIALISRCPGLCLLVVYNMALKSANSFAKSLGHVICVSDCHEQIIYLEFYLSPFGPFHQYVSRDAFIPICSNCQYGNCCKVGETLWITTSPIFTWMPIEFGWLRPVFIVKQPTKNYWFFDCSFMKTAGSLRLLKELEPADLWFWCPLKNSKNHHYPRLSNTHPVPFTPAALA